MIKTYKLSASELKAVKNLKDELRATQDNLQKIQGAFSGFAQLIAQQQSLIEEGAESLRFNAEITELIVTLPDTTAASKDNTPTQ